MTVPCAPAQKTLPGPPHPTNPMPQERLLEHMALKLHVCRRVGRGQWKGVREGEVWVRSCPQDVRREAVPFYVQGGRKDSADS